MGVMSEPRLADHDLAALVPDWLDWAEAGALLEGNADQVQQITDEWVFARNPKSRDPNWKVVTTSQLD